VSDLQKRPYDAESRIKGLEIKLQDQFFSGLEKQKYLVLTMLAVMVAAIVLFILYPR